MINEGFSKAFFHYNYLTFPLQVTFTLEISMTIGKEYPMNTYQVVPSVHEAGKMLVN